MKTEDKKTHNRISCKHTKSL